jgi:DNA-binding NarL/FixJ family response regulator
MRILVVDDHPVVREGVCSLIRSQQDMEVAAVASSGQEAVRAFAASNPDVTVLDLALSDSNGMDVVTQIRGYSPTARILMLTVHDAPGTIRRAIESGALGYVLKDTIGEELIEAIRSVGRGENYLSKPAARRLAESVGRTGLTSREFSVLQHLGQGLSNKAIALRMNISEQTVKTHIRGILEKLGAKDRLEAVVIAAREHLIELE